MCFGIEVFNNLKKNLFITGKGWLSLPPMQDARHQPGATVVDGKFFVAGGYNPVNHSSV
jgi:hypothetical protein